jgi:hypothetical protein
MRFDGYTGQRVAAVPARYFARRSPQTGRFRKAARPVPNIRYLPRVCFTSIDAPDQIMDGCSGFGALQFAYKFLQSREIFLFGCDHDDQGMYFHGENPDARHADDWSCGLRCWNNIAVPENVNVWNCSMTSKIELFPKIDSRDAFAMIGLPAITVVTVLNRSDDRDERHVEWLQQQVGFPIVCLTDSQKSMKNVVSIPLTRGWPGSWSKMELFRSDLCLGNFLYVDLDTVILRGISSAFTARSKSQVISDLFGIPRIESCLRFIHHSARPSIWDAFSRDPEGAIREAGPAGDRGFLDRVLHYCKRLEDTFPGAIISYEADALGKRSGKAYS